jgi:hypothetical protein
MSSKRSAFFCILVLCSQRIQAFELFSDGEAFGFYVENDSRHIGGPGSDQSYTNGLKFSSIFADNKIPNWMEKPIDKMSFLDSRLKESKINFGFSFAQQIYTPNDINLEEKIQSDRPYAAWLYLGFAVSFKEQNTGQFFELDTGFVGPSALGKQTQNNFHDLIHTRTAQGWENSLHDELTLQLFYQKRFKKFKNKNNDFFPYYGLAFGQIQVGAHVGALLRFGFNLPDDFGPSRPSASDGDCFISPVSAKATRQNSYYVFAGARLNALVRNLFLDGNTFQSSPRVTKYPITSETEFGAGMETKPIALVWRFVTRSFEFKERSRTVSFASLNMIYTF